jgi:hypothetical protein
MYEPVADRGGGLSAAEDGGFRGPFRFSALGRCALGCHLRVLPPGGFCVAFLLVSITTLRVGHLTSPSRRPHAQFSSGGEHLALRRLTSSTNRR